MNRLAEILGCLILAVVMFLCGLVTVGSLVWLGSLLADAPPATRPAPKPKPAPPVKPVPVPTPKPAPKPEPKPTPRPRPGPHRP